MNKPTIFKNNQWSVTVDGDLVCESYGQLIERSILEKVNWHEAFGHFEWFDRLLFDQAKERALTITAD